MESDYLFKINPCKGGSSKGSFHWDEVGYLGKTSRVVRLQNPCLFPPTSIQALEGVAIGLHASGARLSFVGKCHTGPHTVISLYSSLSTSI
jgi:hypothetical protein